MMRSRARQGKASSIQKVSIVNHTHTHTHTQIHTQIHINPSPPPRPNNRSAAHAYRKRSPTKPKQHNFPPLPVVAEKVFDLSQAMSLSRQREMAVIRAHPALLKYYNCLVSLFMMAYTSSQLLASNFFQPAARGYPQFGQNFLCLLLTIYSTAKNRQWQHKLKALALNLLRMAASPSEFERKVEFVSRRVVINSEKARKIELAFLNPDVPGFWTLLIAKLTVSTDVEFYEEMFEWEAEKLCFRDFQALVDRYLSRESFEKDLKEAASLEKEAHSFTVEFHLVERLCSEQYPTPERGGSSCSVY